MANADNDFHQRDGHEWVFCSKCNHSHDDKLDMKLDDIIDHNEAFHYEINDEKEYAGDSLPYPHKSVKQLDYEMELYWNSDSEEDFENDFESDNENDFESDNENKFEEEPVTYSDLEFYSSCELEEWLVNQGVIRRIASSASVILYARGYISKSTLIGIEYQGFRREGLSMPIANSLDNILNVVAKNK